MDRTVLDRAMDLATDLDAAAVIVLPSEGFDEDLSSLDTEVPVYVVSSRGEAKGDISLRFLGSSNNFIDRLRDAVMMAYVQDKVDTGDKVVGVGEMDQEGVAIILYSVEEDPLLRSIQESKGRIDAEVMRAVITLAVEIGREGREGRPIGTMFVLGDSDDVMAHSHQMLLNPFQGHPEELRDVRNPENWENIKELAQIEGAFVIDDSGVVLAAGRYLDVEASDIKITQGLGARHTAAAAMSKKTDAITVVIAESGGVVRIFKDGEIIGEIEPRVHVLRV